MEPDDALSVFLGPKLRIKFYAAITLAWVGLSSAMAGYAALGMDTPSWLIAALAVYGGVAGSFGVVALANTEVQQKIDEREKEGERGRERFARK